MREVARKLTPALALRAAREHPEQNVERIHSDSYAESDVAIVRNQDVFAAVERERGAGVNPFVAFASGCKRDLALTIELEAAVVDRALQMHVAQHPAQLLVAEPVSLESERLDRFGHPNLHWGRTSRSLLTRAPFPFAMRKPPPREEPGRLAALAGPSKKRLQRAR